MAEQELVKTYPVRAKLKPNSKTSESTPESKFWKSFKPQSAGKPLISSISSLSFSPISPHDFAATHSATVTIFSSQTIESKSTISAFNDTATSATYRSDGRLIAAGSHSGVVKVFDVKTRTALRQLRGHSRPVHLAKFPRVDKLHLISGGDDAIVKYWDVATETPLYNLTGHKDYVRCGDGSPASDDMFVTGSYDHSIRVWDVRVSPNRASVMDLKHESPVEDVIFLPSGGLIATAGGNSVKIWDVIGGGKLLYSMESHNKTVTSICVGKIAKESGEEARILSVSLDGYLKAFDYGKFKITYSMRFPSPLLSVAFSPDTSTRIVGSSNGIIYAGKRKTKKTEDKALIEEEPGRRTLRPSYFRYFQRGQNEKPSDGDYTIMKPKKVKLSVQDKLLKKFRHKEALVAVLKGKNPEEVVAVMEELVARKKLMRSVSNLEIEELGLLLGFLQKYSTVPRYAGLLMRLAKKVVEMRVEDIKGHVYGDDDDDTLKVHIRNLKRSIDEEIRVQEILQEVQGMISPLLRIAGRTTPTSIS